MTGDVTVRRLRVGDAAGWRELRLEMLADTPIAYAEHHADALRRSDSDWSGDVAQSAAGSSAARFVAVGCDGSWLGCAAGFAPREDVPAGSSVLGSVYVRPAWRGRGVLEPLVAAVSAWSAAARRPGLWLQVAAENPRAVSAYRRLGFVATGRTDAHPLFLGVTELTMARD